MFTQNYSFAGHIIEICSIYKDVHDYCIDYRTNAAAEFSVTTDMNDISYERDCSRNTDIAEGRTPVEYTDGYLEELAVYRKIAEKAPEWDTILFHGSVIAVDGEGFLFTAKSGTGKSTHTRLWRKLFGERAVMINDDKPLLRITSDSVIAYGTPYNGKHRLSTNTSAPLKGICVLTRGKTNSIVPLSKSEAYSVLIQQTYRPIDVMMMQKTMTLIDRLAENTKLYRLSCNMDPEAAEVAYQGMKG